MSSISKLPIISEIKNKIENKQFDEAIELLKSSNDIPQNVKLYNLGYLHFQKKDFVKSKKYYEQARLEGMFTRDLDLSLNEVNQELAISLVESQYTAYEKFLFTYLLMPSSQLIMLYSFLGLLTLLSLYKKWVVSGISFMAILIFFAGHAYWINDYELIYNEEETFLYGGPSAIFEEVGVIPPGAKVILGKSKYEWQHIDHPEFFKGWIKKGKDEL